MSCCLLEAPEGQPSLTASTGSATLAFLFLQYLQFFPLQEPLHLLFLLPGMSPFCYSSHVTSSARLSIPLQSRGAPPPLLASLLPARLCIPSPNHYPHTVFSFTSFHFSYLDPLPLTHIHLTVNSMGKGYCCLLCPQHFQLGLPQSRTPVYITG